MSKKILVLGVGQNNFLSFLYSTLKHFDAAFTVTAPFYRELHKSVKNDSWMYENSGIAQKKSVLTILKSIFLVLFERHFYQTFFFILFVEAKIKKAFHFALKHVLAKAFFLQHKNFKDYDTFHFHYMQYSYLRELFLVPKGKKIVCSFWGSDLLRTSDIMNYYFVKKALKKATLITCQSLELKEIILSKYGRKLESKIRIAIFPIDSNIYKGINSFRDEKEIVDAFKSSYNYSSQKINVLIGHNGSVFNNHEKIILALSQIQNKGKVHFIVNLNYAIKEDEKVVYRNKLTKVLTNSGVSFVVLENFFSNQELSVSRLASDIFVHMPVSDALSGTMLELLYGSNIVITGEWLPYKTFRKAGLHYHEVSDFSELSVQFDSIINHFETEKKIAIQNRPLIEQFFFSEKGIKNWAEILN